MTFERKSANFRASVVHGLYCPSSQNLMKKALHEITVNIFKASLILFPLSLVPQ